MPAAIRNLETLTPVESSAVLQRRRFDQPPVYQTLHEDDKGVVNCRGDGGVIYFLDCELHIEKREIVSNGELQRVQPRVFDLLHYLLKNRNRVVTRDELLQHVWKNAYVSDSVIGRCVMKARRVIRDSNPDAPLIKTLPRAGYRFTGAASTTSFISQKTVHVPLQRKKIAVLPFLNSTGITDLVWAEFGLAALFNKAVEKDPDFSTLSVLEVICLIESDNSNNPHAQIIKTLHASQDVAAVVRSEIVRHDEGFELCVEVHSVDRKPIHQHSCGADLAKMTLQVAEAVLQGLKSLEHPASTTEFVIDPFVSEALTRSHSERSAQRYGACLKYLQVCMISGTQTLESEIQHLDMLEKVENIATEHTAKVLLAKAQSLRDQPAEARIFGVLSSFAIKNGDDDLGKKYLDRGISLVDNSDSKLVAELLLKKSTIAVLEREFKIVSALGNSALTAVQDEVGEIAAQRLLHEAHVLYSTGFIPQALELYRHAAKMSRSPKSRHADIAASLGGIACIYADSGRLLDAQKLLTEAIDSAVQCGSPSEYARTLFLELEINGFLSTNDPGCSSSFELLNSRRLRQTFAGNYYSLIAEACWKWGQNDPIKALSIFQTARPPGMLVRGHWLSNALCVGTGMAIVAGNYELARDFIADMEAHERFFIQTVHQGTPQFFKAALAHVYGDREEAWSILKNIHHLGPGPVRSKVCLALAWLACEERNLVEAQNWLAQVDYLVQEHPSGVAVLARYKYEIGSWQVAAVLQEQLLCNTANSRMKPFNEYLHSTYLQAVTSGRTSAIRRLPHLFTLLPFNL